jgi:DNA repair photolyase
MSVIYTPKGKAGEYADLACNLYTGCTHGCEYCYVPTMLRKKPDIFHGSSTPRKGILDKILKEAPEHTGKGVFLCFTCDPYCLDVDHTITRKAIKIFHNHNIAVNILTKGGELAVRDFDLLAKRPELSSIGATLTFDNKEDSDRWEPKAAEPGRRCSMLAQAHALGIQTWASLEPVIDPEQTLSLIKATHSYVNHFKVGRWNHDKRADEIDWASFLNRVTTLLEKLGASYYIKKDLAIFSDKGME